MSIIDEGARERRWKGCVHPFEADEPTGYASWHEWAKRHDAPRTACPKCGLFVICHGALRKQAS